MDNKIFFTKLLGLHGPWYIADVTLDAIKERVDIFVEHRQGVRFPCPICLEFCGIYDHTDERIFRHLNICQMTAWIHVRIPRIQCSKDGIHQITHGLAEKNGTTTYEFERLIIDFEQECSIESTCRLLNVDWHTCQQIQERAVERGMERKPHALPGRIGVDEKSFAKGHKYETLVYDIDKGTVDYVCDRRDQDSLESYYRRFDEKERGKVEAVAMDMWDPYIAATKKYIPDAERKIVFDRFHAMKHVTEAVDRVRKHEHQVLQARGDETLKGTRYLWLWNEENMPDWRKEEFDGLRAKELKVCRAWAIKENIRHLWDYVSEGCMRKFFKRWYGWAVRSRLKPIKDAAKTLKHYFDNIVTYAKHQITNALGESLNSKIEKVKRLACGYRNRSHYRTAIYFHCGGLDLYPTRKPILMQVIM
jgi:transposase